MSYNTRDVIKSVIDFSQTRGIDQEIIGVSLEAAMVLYGFKETKCSIKKKHLLINQ